MGWLDGFRDDCQRTINQSLKICLVANLRGEGSEYFGSIVFSPVEAPVNNGLDTVPEGRKTRCDNQRRSYGGEFRVGSQERLQHLLQHDDTDRVH